MFAPRVRKFALTVHVVCSVGWLGAVGTFLALAIGGLVSENPAVVRSAYVSMEVTAWTVIVPMSLASPLSGIIQGLGTSWGLFRHYWVVAKLVLTIPATAFLLLHMRAIGHASAAAVAATLSDDDLRRLRLQLVVDAAAAAVVLIVTTVLSIYKPKGVTPYGYRRQVAATDAARTPY